MKPNSSEAKQFAALISKLKKKFEPEEPDVLEPVTQLVVSLLQWEASRAKADRAFGALMEELVDINELRVSHEHELVALIGEDYPLAEERVTRMRECLNEVFVREYGVSLKNVEAMNKKDQRIYLDTLPGCPPYVAAQVMLVCFGAHALPVDSKLVALLAGEGILEEGTDPAEAESQILRVLKAGETLEAHAALQAWSDSSRRISPHVAAARAEGSDKKKSARTSK